MPEWSKGRGETSLVWASWHKILLDSWMNIPDHYRSSLIEGGASLGVLHVLRKNAMGRHLLEVWLCKFVKLNKHRGFESRSWHSNFLLWGIFFIWVLWLKFDIWGEFFLRNTFYERVRDGRTFRWCDTFPTDDRIRNEMEGTCKIPWEKNKFLSP